MILSIWKSGINWITPVQTIISASMMDWRGHEGARGSRYRRGNRYRRGGRGYSEYNRRNFSNSSGGASNDGSFWNEDTDGSADGNGRRRERGQRYDTGESAENVREPRGRPPRGLRGRDIGMWYAQHGRAKMQKEERDNRAYVQLDKTQERQLSGLLASIRSSDACPPQPSRSYKDPLDDVPVDRSKHTLFSSETQEETPDSWTDRFDTDASHATSAPGPRNKSYSSLAGSDFIPLEVSKPNVGDRIKAHDVTPSTSHQYAAPIDRKRKSDDSVNSSEDELDDNALFHMTEQMEENYQNSIGEMQELEEEAQTVKLYDREEADSQFLHEFHQQKLANRRSYNELNKLGLARRPIALHRDTAFDRSQLEILRAKQQSAAYQRMFEFRKKLPSYNMRQELLDVINANQVTVISGETGCGKTTQVPQFILDDYIERGDASLCRIVCTQPRRISAISVAERVADERCEKCGENSVGFQIRLENKLPKTNGSILYCTVGIMLRRLASDSLLSGTTHIVLDEIHERDLHSDFLMIILRDLLPKRPNLKVILMSATLNAEMFSQYFGNCPTLNIPGYTFPVTDHYIEDVIEMLGYVPEAPKFRKKIPRGEKGREQQQEQEMYRHWCEGQKYNRFSMETVAVLKEMDYGMVDVNLAGTLTEHICRYKADGAILVFMPGWEQIKQLNTMLTKQRFFSKEKFLIIPLHSMMPTVNQREVFKRPPPGVRKIVIATNIAETSITIDDVVYVIDCGKIKMKNFDLENNLATLDAEWVSHANARQRRGRAGRVQPGECFHLFTRYHLDQLKEYQLPEILRTRLEELCLQIKLLKLGRVEPFVQKAMQPPSLEALRLSVAMLRDINAFDDQEELTPLGYHLAKMPVDPHCGKMLLFGAMFSCLDPMLTVAASLSYKDAFVVPMGKESVVDKKRVELSRGSRSDHIMLVNAFKGWERAKERGTSQQYCWDNFLSPSVLNLLYDMRKQFCKFLYEMKFIPAPDPKWKASNLNSNHEAVLKAVICAGLYPNVAKEYGKARKYRPAKLRTKSDRVNFHLKSVNVAKCESASQWCVYHQKLKSTKIFLYDSTFVSPLSILLFGGDINLGENNRETCEVTIDEWIQFGSSHKIAKLVRELRVELDKLLEYKITHPGPTDWNISSKEGALMKAIIDLIIKEEFTTLGSIKHSFDEKL